MIKIGIIKVPVPGGGQYDVGLLTKFLPNGTEVSVQCNPEFDLEEASEALHFLFDLIQEASITDRDRAKCLVVDGFDTTALFLAKKHKIRRVATQGGVRSDQMVCPYCHTNQLPMSLTKTAQMLKDSGDEKPIFCKECRAGFYLDMDRDWVFRSIGNCELQTPGGKHDFQLHDVDGYDHQIPICVKCGWLKPWHLWRPADHD